MPDAFRKSAFIAVSPERIYAAWMDAAGHSEMTGGGAEVDPRVGGRFTAWDGYIEGTTLELEPTRRIVQAWRSADFPEDAPDSRLEVLLHPEAGGTLVELVHSDIPDGQGPNYAQGWEDFYFTPMRAWAGR